MKKLEEIKQITNLKIIQEAEDGFLAIWTNPIDRKQYSIILSWGGGWEHLSVNPISQNKTPSWDFMCQLKEMFFRDDEACVEYHPARKDYISQLDHCLHIWKPLREKLPVPPSIFVGLKKKY